jgi:hypothetical protein
MFEIHSMNIFVVHYVTYIFGCLIYVMHKYIYMNIYNSLSIFTHKITIYCNPLFLVIIIFQLYFSSYMNI